MVTLQKMRMTPLFTRKRNRRMSKRQTASPRLVPRQRARLVVAWCRSFRPACFGGAAGSRVDGEGLDKRQRSRAPNRPRQRAPRRAVPVGAEPRRHKERTRDMNRRAAGESVNASAVTQVGRVERQRNESRSENRRQAGRRQGCTEQRTSRRRVSATGKGASKGSDSCSERSEQNWRAPCCPRPEAPRPKGVGGRQ